MNMLQLQVPYLNIIDYIYETVCVKTVILHYVFIHLLILIRMVFNKITSFTSTE
jgi:hypothetical protein